MPASEISSFPLKGFCSPPVNMTTLGQLLLQIFKRKDMIIEQMQQQADSYSQDLASRLLIDGITPPTWLLSPNFNPHSSDPNELEKLKITSKLLAGPPRYPTRYSTDGCSLYYHASNKALNVSNEPIVTCGGNEIGRGLNLAPALDDNVKSTLNEVGARISNIHAAPEVLPESHNNDIGCSLNRSPELDDNVKSPLNEMGAKISNIYAAPDVSLECHNNDIGCSLNRVAVFGESVESPQNETNARITSTYRIQRSKSRQKARKLRTNMKTTAKSCLSNENRTHIAFSGDSKSKKNFYQIAQDKHSSEMDKCNDISGSTFMTSEEKGDKANVRTNHSCTLSKSSSPHGKPSLENDLTEKGTQSSSGKENLDVGIMVQPMGDSLEQYGHINSVMEGVNIPDCSLGSYASKMSRTGKMKGIQSHNKPFCGRITRSRSSSRQITGINKSSNGVTSVSHSVGDFQQKIDVTNKLLDAVETSKVLSDRIQEMQAICSNGGVSKPVISSNTDMKESSSRGGNHQENTEVVVGNGPIDASVVMQPVNSGMKVIPKHLNFDEISECDLNETCSPLSKKQKLDGLVGQKCFPSKDFASSVDHKSHSSFFEQQSNHNNTDECAIGEVMNSGLEMNQNLVVEDVEHNSKVSQHDNTDVAGEVNISSKEVGHVSNEEMHLGDSHLNKDRTSSLQMQIKEGDLGHKGEESASGVLKPISQNSKSSIISRLTKQGNKDFEVGSNLKLSNLKLNSAKFNTCPLNQQKNAEYQPNCFSDSRKYRVHIQSDVIYLNLKTPETDSNSVKSFHNEMICDLPEGTKSLHELQPAEATEVDDGAAETTDTLKQPEPTSVINMIKNAADVGPANPVIDDLMDTDIKDFDIHLPEWGSSYKSADPSENDEGLIKDVEIGNLNMETNEVEMDIDMIARASIIEQICKSASMQTPLPQFPSSFVQHQIQDINGLLADGVLDNKGITTTNSLDEGFGKCLLASGSCVTETDSAFPQHQKVSYGTPIYWQSKYHYSSPTGKLRERSSSSSGSSEKRLSSNPDLTCFPIEEDPSTSSNEEGENAEEGSDELQHNIISNVENNETKTERSGDDYEVAVEIKKPPPDSTKSIKDPDRRSSNSVNIEVSVLRTRDKVKSKPKLHHGFKVSTYEENRNSSIVTRASSRGNLSEISKNKSSMRSGIPRLSQKEARRNNIVSNITSFIPMVQQKQAAAICTGKRDVKVKALEAAEAARRLEHEKENERRLKKEALKLERSRIEKENLIKKREELKKKEADIAERKRLREEEEMKQAAKKRKLVAEAQKNRKVKFEKTQARREEIQKHVKNAANPAIVGNKKKSENLRLNKNADESSVVKQETELRNDKTSTNVVQQVTSVLENLDASNACGAQEKATSADKKTPIKVGPAKLTSQEISYEISPYKCSDDEQDEEDDEDVPTKKFVPSWASRNRVAMVLPLQQKLNPESIFPVDSFCSPDEVLLPRRLQGR